MKDKILKTDVLIIGTGIAGCVAALKLAQNPHIRILLVTKSSDIKQSSTFLAQGGIIGKAPSDSKAKLKKDILKTGDGLCNEKAVEILANEGPGLVDDVLIKLASVDFTKKHCKLDFTKEAAHSVSRILYKNDHTGEEIETKLTAKVGSMKNITVLTDHTLIDLLTFPHHAVDAKKIYNEKKCVGCYLFDNKEETVKTILAKKTILATGGIGQVYQRTTNPETATGDGLAAAARAGVEIINAEYVQFHPTSLFHRDLNNFLISESVRGEGGILKDRKERSFMEKYDKRGSLASRDIVSRGIFEEMTATKQDYVYLDLASRMKPDEIIRRFPLIYKTCIDLGLDITKEMIPVAPTAHYFCGGIKVDENGQSSIKNLYALGEVSCTGVHGANRLASTSLLEGLVWAVRCSKKISETLGQEKIVHEKDVKKWIYTGNVKADPALIRQDWMNIKSIMWNYVGIVRTEERLNRAVADLNYLGHRIETFYRNAHIDKDKIELRNGVQTAQIIAQAAKMNRIARGCHYRK